jgi:dephospho-CoA kinase
MMTTIGAHGQPVLLLGGGIGAGKSRVASEFAERGFEVVEADKVGHDVLERNEDAIASVADVWPEAVEDGMVDRQTLAGIVFADPTALARLESITHPLIREILTARIERAQGPVVVEIPLMKVLFKEPYLHVAVVADQDVREDRAVERGANRGDVRRRMENQQSDEQWVAWADRVIENTGDWDATREAVHMVIDEILGDD